MLAAAFFRTDFLSTIRIWPREPRYLLALLSLLASGGLVTELLSTEGLPSFSTPRLPQESRGIRDQPGLKGLQQRSRAVLSILAAGFSLSNDSLETVLDAGVIGGKIGLDASDGLTGDAAFAAASFFRSLRLSFVGGAAEGFAFFAAATSALLAFSP